jgi:hypothetical protein
VLQEKAASEQWKEQEGFEFVSVPEMIERTGFVVP